VGFRFLRSGGVGSEIWGAGFRVWGSGSLEVKGLTYHISEAAPLQLRRLRLECCALFYFWKFECFS
jgi:hypothetical protein